jgi:putative exporter of polyketide antibiotics
LVRTVPRWQWLATRLGVGAGLVVVASLFTGVASWVGAASQHSGVSIGDLAQAGLNIAPPGLFVLGLGAVVFGVAPGLASGIVYAVVAWSLLIEVIASVVQSNRILLDSSVLSHLAPAPAASPNWTAAAWLSGLGLLGAVIGIVAFHRRDLVPA